jgi:hypothetical protein
MHLGSRTVYYSSRRERYFKDSTTVSVLSEKESPEAEFSEVGWHTSCWNAAGSLPHPGHFDEHEFWNRYNDPERGESPIHQLGDEGDQLLVGVSIEEIGTPELYRAFIERVCPTTEDTKASYVDIERVKVRQDIVDYLRACGSKSV